VRDEWLTWGVLLGADALTGDSMAPALLQASNARLLGLAAEVDDGGEEGRDVGTVAARRGVGRVYSSYQALLDDPEIACVAISLPVGSRREWTVRAAEAGKHVLCASPLAVDRAGLHEMEAACRAADVTLMEGVGPLFHPRVERLRDLLARRVIGDLRHLSVDFGLPTSLGEGGDTLVATDANALLELTSCCVAVLLALIGAQPVSVAAVAAVGLSGETLDLEGLLEFRGGVTAQLVCSLIAAEANEWLAIGGEAGAISAPHPAFTAGPSDAAPICVHLTGAPELDVLPGVPADPWLLMVEAFSQAILRGEPAPYTLSESRATLRVLEALARSADTGAPVRPDRR
jgi:xylose dehydrogenase (NAD/NADP)